MKKLISGLFFAMIFLGILFYGCNKNNPAPASPSAAEGENTSTVTATVSITATATVTVTVTVTPVLPLNISWCSIQFPNSVSVSAGESFGVWGRVYEDEVTNITNYGACDSFGVIEAQFGYGPVGSAVLSYTWTDASCNAASTLDQSNLDEYSAYLAISASGIYEGLYRFRLNEGPYYYAADSAGSLAVTDPSLIPNRLQVTIY